MKSKGFTLVEILAVITILAILVGIAVPNMAGLATKNRGKMFCAKATNIAKAAQQWGEENIDEIESKRKTSITVKELIEDGKLKKEDDACNFGTKPCTTDPRNQASMDSSKVDLQIKNRRVYATFHFEGNDGDYCAKN